MLCQPLLYSDSVLPMYTFKNILFHYGLSQEIFPFAILWDPVAYLF